MIAAPQPRQIAGGERAVVQGRPDERRIDPDLDEPLELLDRGHSAPSEQLHIRVSAAELLEQRHIRAFAVFSALAADCALTTQTERTMLATDVIAAFPQAFRLIPQNDEFTWIQGGARQR